MSRAEGHAGEKIGLKKAYLHHLSLIGDDRHEQLSWVTKGGGTFQVSHLCHNAGCFAPRHLIVEEAILNKSRNSCQGHEIISYSGEGPMRYHPCQHGGKGKVFVNCILPTCFITDSGTYYNSNA